MLEIAKLTVGYEDHTVLQEVSLQAEKGQITVIIGPNGCGKSTLLKGITGILQPKEGTILLEGNDLSAFTRTERARRISYLAQNREVPDITAGRMVLHGRFPWLSYPKRYRKEDEEAAEAAMKRMGIEEFRNIPLKQMSGGERQKVYIAMAIAQSSDVILMDEPSSFLDISCQLDLYRMAKELAQQGKYVLMVLHDLPAALTVADRIVLLDKGKHVISGTPEEVYCSKALDRTFGVKIKRQKAEEKWVYYF